MVSDLRNLPGPPFTREGDAWGAPDAEAWQVLIGYPRRFQSAGITPLGNGGGFSGARLWRVEVPAGSFCLRAVSAAMWEVSRLRGLHRLLKHVFNAGVTAVSVPVAAESGATVVELGGHLWQLEPWLPGVSDFDRHPTDDRLTAAMVCLARWHRAAERFEATDSERPWFAKAAAAPSPAVIERRQRIREWSAARCDDVERRLANLDWPDFRALGQRLLQLFRVHAEPVARDLEIARDIAVPLQPCLRDIWHDHVLFTGNEVTGLIDANACRTESVAADIARLLGSLVADDRLRWRFAIDVYHSVRPLSLSELGLIEILDHSGVLLNGLTWLEWICLDHRPFEDSDRPRIENRLAGHVRRLERLGDASTTRAVCKS
ncbi:MAG: phosphotransferase [Planctomycetales bacterium]|nr:phosphotransferase [Planctomycetales bacterium]